MQHNMLYILHIVFTKVNMHQRILSDN